MEGFDCSVLGTLRQRPPSIHNHEKAANGKGCGVIAQSEARMSHDLWARPEMTATPFSAAAPML